MSVSKVEALIQGLAGVEAARIVLDDRGAVREIHVLADSSRSPKSVARDVLSALHARWGLAVDRRRISVAQLAQTSPRPKAVRLRLKQLSITTDPVRSWTEVSVALAPVPPVDPFGRPVRDREVPRGEWLGRAAGPAGGDSTTLRLAAQAALEALNQSLVPSHGFSLVDVARVSLGGYGLVVCLLHHHAARGEPAVLSGSAVVRNGIVDAAVRATLNATNRIFEVTVRRNFPQSDQEDDADVPDWVGDVAAGVDPRGLTDDGPESGDLADE